VKLSERQQLFARDVVKLLLFMDEKGINIPLVRQ